MRRGRHRTSSALVGPWQGGHLLVGIRYAREASGDGTRSFGNEEVFTAVAYMRAARLEDDTAWSMISF